MRVVSCVKRTCVGTADMTHEEHCKQLLENMSRWSRDLTNIIEDLNARSAALKAIGYGEG